MMLNRPNEVDVDLNMKGIPFRLAQPHQGIFEPAVPVGVSRRHGRHGRPTPAGYGHIGAGAGAGDGSGQLYNAPSAHLRAPAPGRFPRAVAAELAVTAGRGRSRRWRYAMAPG